MGHQGGSSVLALSTGGVDRFVQSGPVCGGDSSGVPPVPAPLRRLRGLDFDPDSGRYGFVLALQRVGALDTTAGSDFPRNVLVPDPDGGLNPPRAAERGLVAHDGRVDGL